MLPSNKQEKIRNLKMFLPVSPDENLAPISPTYTSFICFHSLFI